MCSIWGFSMDDEEFGYIQLRKIQEAERKTPLLTKIHDNFYEKGMNHLQKLQNRLELETKSSRNMILHDQIQSIEKILKSIYELREKKIILAAMAKARGGNPSEKHFLESELDLFNQLYALLMETRKQIFSSEIEDLDNEITILNEEEKKTKKPIDKIPSKKDNKEIKDHTIIRLKDTIPTFIGTDSKQYSLHEGDIISLPAQLGKMLVNKNVAEILNIS